MHHRNRVDGINRVVRKLLCRLSEFRVCSPSHSHHVAEVVCFGRTPNVDVTQLRENASPVACVGPGWQVWVAPKIKPLHGN